MAASFLGGAPGPLAVCIGGPRESEAPGIYGMAKSFLTHLMARQN
jgi:hypothetical protein